MVWIGITLGIAYLGFVAWVIRSCEADTKQLVQQCEDRYNQRMDELDCEESDV